jgi:hypothetical protein
VLTLIGTGLGISGMPVNTEVSGRLGITRAWTADLWTDEDNLYAGVTHIGASPESKSLSESYLAGMALINQGADLLAGSGMGEAVKASRRAVAASGSRGYGFSAFGSLAISSSSYETGSHVDMKSLSLVTGLALGIGDAAAAVGFTTLVAFFEYGTGSYDSYNSFVNSALASVHGEGDMRYLGGGLSGRFEFNETGPGSFYLEASARAGKTYNDYDSSDLFDPATGQRASYDSDTSYFGLHFGTGYVFTLSDNSRLDLYGKYFFTRQKGDEITLPNGDPVRFEGSDSKRLRLGGRFSFSINDHISPYIGAAFEHEYDGRAGASTYGYPIDAPSLQGDTGIGEFGLSLRPSVDFPLSFDLGAQLYTGKRDGKTGSLQVKFEF